jgi:hypothetical protein
MRMGIERWIRERAEPGEAHRRGEDSGEDVQEAAEGLLAHLPEEMCRGRPWFVGNGRRYAGRASPASSN